MFTSNQTEGIVSEKAYNVIDYFYKKQVKQQYIVKGGVYYKGFYITW